jgi:hypothetical protein
MTKMDNNYLLQKQLELMIDMNSKKMAAEIAKLNETVIRLNDEMREVRRSMLNGSGATRISGESVSAQRIMAQGQVAEVQKPAELRAPEIRPQSSQELKPRSGDYKSDDVSIDKFFYFGGGKR